MGYETQCRVVSQLDGGERCEADARVLLETDDLIVRGGVRLKIPRDTVTSVKVKAGTLTVRHAAGAAMFALGPQATAWAERITAPAKPLLDKLGVRPDSQVSVLGVRDDAFLADLAARAPAVTRGRATSGSDVIFLGVERQSDLARITSASRALAPAGALWVIHRKGPTGVRDTAIFAAAVAAGLTYTKVVRFSDTHTGEKLVIPRSARK
jgi:hypothetical protein